MRARSGLGQIRSLGQDRFLVRISAGVDTATGKRRQPSRVVRGTRQEESQAWKNWPAVEANGFTTLFAYGPDGRMGYWGMVWNTAQDMRSTLCQNMGGGVPIEVIDKLVSLSVHIVPHQD